MASARHDPHTTLVVGHVGGVDFFMAQPRWTSWQTFSGEQLEGSTHMGMMEVGVTESTSLRDVET